VSASDHRSRVVVIGGGFGGLEAVKALSRADVDITLIDRHNYHLFQPLSYQVATGSLSPGEIAEPLRQVFRDKPRVTVLMGEVRDFELERRQVIAQPVISGTKPCPVSYDTLLVAGGSSYSYFGHDDWAPLALEVKSLDSALQVRGRILEAFEAAELDSERDERSSWLTFVVVGGGPTGVEMAGQIAELARDTLPREFRRSDTRAGRVLLIEMADRVLGEFPPSLSRRATRSLQQIGVTPMLSQTVVDIKPGHVQIQSSDGNTSTIPTHTVIWAAGVRASPLAKVLGEASGADVDRAGRVLVEPDLSLPGHPEVLAFGDMVRVKDAPSGEPRVFPGLAPVAMQQGRYAARLVADRLAGRSTPPFRYLDKGTLATIGRARAVADIRGLRVSGFVAWLMWLCVHLYYLIGFENRLLVMIRWSYSFFTRGRGTRLITAAADAPQPVAEQTTVRELAHR
jgi:NADH:quinone reductase (non-electrogenic)